MDVLLLEDDIDLGQAVTDHLEANGHHVSWMKLVAQAEVALADPAIALALLDLHLPDGDAIGLLQRQRARGDMRPMIVITARDQVSDRIRGLQAGADDYLVKPFDLDELLARIDAVARRSGAASPLAVRCGDVTLDFAHHRASLADAAVELTAMEWSVLECLARRPRRIWSRGDIETTLANEGRANADSNSVEVIVSRLRKKLGAALISTHRGLGYRLED